MSDSLRMDGKTVIITGATSGIGLEAAVQLAAAGAYVLGVGRSAERAEKARLNVLSRVPGADIHFLIADLSRQGEIHHLADAIRNELQEQKIQSLDALVNNAGVFTDRYTLSEDGIEMTLAVNHIAPFLLTLELLPLLKSCPQSRVVTISSNSHYPSHLNTRSVNKPLIYNGLFAYQDSKLANILFTAELNGRLAGAPPRAFAVDPGLVNTAFGEKATRGLVSWVWSQRRKKGAAPEQPARSILFCCAEPSLQHTKELYWRDSRPKQPSALALDPKAASELWDLSCRLCSLPVGEGIPIVGKG